jgi:hypothetical protein
MPLPSSEIKANVVPIARLQQREKGAKGLRRSEMQRKPSKLKRGPVGYASAVQKAKVKREGLRIEAAGHFSSGHLEPAHIVSRTHGGCNDEDCVTALTHTQHLLYDRGELDVLPHLTLDEQAHAVKHIGILGALKRTTGENYVPESEVNRRIGVEMSHEGELTP